MKNLNDILVEKLNIKNINIKADRRKIKKYEDYESSIKHFFYELHFVKTPGIEYTDELRMRRYKSTNSNPKRLVNSINDNNKLVRRWLWAVYLKWDDAIYTFGSEIDKRLSNKGITLDFLHSYILWNYLKNKANNFSFRTNAYEHYLDLYNIEHNL